MKEWLIWLILGILSVAFGVFALGNAFVASLAITTITGALLLISGVFQVVGAFRVDGMGNKILALLMGAVMIFLGWSFLDNPLQGVITLTFVVLILLVASGLTRIILSFQMRGTEFFWPTLVSGILSLLLAMVVLNAGVAGVKFLGIMLGIEMLFNGFGLIFMAMFLRKSPQHVEP